MQMTKHPFSDQDIAMLRTIMIAVATAGVLAGPALAADATGLWQAEMNGAQIEIFRCGASLCGKLISSDRIKTNPAQKDENNRDPAQRGRPVKNLQMLYGFTGGPSKWIGGKVYNPDDGGTYSGTIELIGDTQLKLKGCIVAPLCKTQVWTRIR
jgi:uncharacterized protein (DUF2147 family)